MARNNDAFVMTPNRGRLNPPKYLVVFKLQESIKLGKTEELRFSKMGIKSKIKRVYHYSGHSNITGISQVGASLTESY